jgi:agmatinase
MSKLDLLPPEQGFLGFESDEYPPLEQTRAVVVPFGLEASVSYGTGTRRGPAALLAASQQLEYFDDEFWREPWRDYGIATCRPLDVAPPVKSALERLAQTIEIVLESGRFPLTVGGEHTLTAGAIRPFCARHDRLCVLHFDAHADLRDSFRGDRLSHACALRRVLDHDGVELISIGLRNISAEEAAFVEANPDRVTCHWARERHNWDIGKIVRPLAGRPVYLTFDLDVFDAGIMPATGTPEPGGLSFDMACAFIREAARIGNIVGADIVELAPVEGLAAYDFTAAKLAYKVLSYVLAPPPTSGA